MVGQDLTTASCPVVLHHPERASGLADLLQQFLQQNLAASPKKAARAARLEGAVLFRSAEDPRVCVRIRFAHGAIELCDVGHLDDAEHARLPSITSDFVATGELTTGQSSPLALLLRRRVRAHATARQARFLFLQDQKGESCGFVP
mgnify:CR=1 FL=1